MPSKILRDEEGNKYEWICDYESPDHMLCRRLPKPEPTLEEKVQKLCDQRGYNSEWHLNFVNVVIEEVGKVYGIKKLDGK